MEADLLSKEIEAFVKLPSAGMMDFITRNQNVLTIMFFIHAYLTMPHDDLPEDWTPMILKEDISDAPKPNNPTAEDLAVATKNPNSAVSLNKDEPKLAGRSRVKGEIKGQPRAETVVHRILVRRVMKTMNEHEKEPYLLGYINIHPRGVPYVCLQHACIHGKLSYLETYVQAMGCADNILLSLLVVLGAERSANVQAVFDLMSPSCQESLRNVMKTLQRDTESVDG